MLKWDGIDHFHEYLCGSNFEVYTDNSPLSYVLTSAKLDAVCQCWIAGLANCNFHLHYKSGKNNIEADALSRIPWSSCREDCNHLDGQAMKAIMMGSTIKTPLFKSYQGRAIISKSLHTSVTEDLLFPIKGDS